MTLCVRVLGSAAGGGLPQWNCGCPNCNAARAGDERIPPRTQDSIAVCSGHPGAFVLVNASPDVLRQIEAAPALHPRGPRHSPIAAVVLTNGDLDHVLGLFSLRESYPLAIYATDAVRRGLVEKNAFCRTLDRFAGQSVWRRLPLGREIELCGPAGEPTGLVVTPFPLPGKLPVHLVNDAAPSDEDNIGLRLREPRASHRVVYAAAAADIAPRDVEGADVLFLDGTFWSEDELSRLGLSKAIAKDMAHLPIGGPSGSLAKLAGCDARRRIYTHINNTNPVLVAGSPERREVEAAGWEIAEDGLEITLTV